MTHKFYGAIFDIDGTVIESAGVWNGFAGRILAPYQKHCLPEDEKRFAAMTLEQSAAYMKEHYSLNATVKTLTEQMDAELDAGYSTNAAEIPGARELLCRLKTDGIKICAATASSKQAVTRVLNRLGLLDFFDFLLTCDKGLNKTDASIYTEAALRLHIAPKCCAVFEDTEFAAAAAERAGFTVFRSISEYK